MQKILISASFDRLRSSDVRFLEEASKLGAVEVLLWSDAAVERQLGKPPAFPEKGAAIFSRAHSVRHFGDDHRLAVSGFDR